MSAGFTPGPWSPHPIKRWVCPEADLEMPICLLRYETAGVAVPEVEVLANAHLIAAAPELYEALGDIIDAIPDSLLDGSLAEAVVRGRTARRKARGDA